MWGDVGGGSYRFVTSFGWFAGWLVFVLFCFVLLFFSICFVLSDLVPILMLISWVLHQNGISKACYIVKIYPFAPESSICSSQKMETVVIWTHFLAKATRLHHS